jgi:hypothetical protein
MAHHDAVTSQSDARAGVPLRGAHSLLVLLVSVRRDRDSDRDCQPVTQKPGSTDT